MNLSRFVLTSLAAAAAMALVGCSGEEPAETEKAAADGPSMIERSAPQQAQRPVAQISEDEDFRVMPRVEGALEEEGMGLDVIIDASSKRAYGESLRWIAEDVSSEQMASLERSIRFIHMYHPAVLGQESRMFDAIDGKTGNEVIAMASELITKRGSR